MQGAHLADECNFLIRCIQYSIYSPDLGINICNTGDIDQDMDFWGASNSPKCTNHDTAVWVQKETQDTKKAAWTTNNKGNSAKVINGVGNACDLDSILCCSNHPIKLCSIWITGSSAPKLVGDRALRLSRALTQLLIGNDGHDWNAVISHEFRASSILQQTIPLQ